MSLIPDDLRYTKNHEWVSVDENGIATCGVTDHAQRMLEDIIFVELPEPGKSVHPKDHVAVIESELSVLDVNAPVGGKIIEVNSALEETPEVINDDPYGEGWLFKIAVKGKIKTTGLFEPDEYSDYLAQQDDEDEDDEGDEDDEEDEFEE